MTRPITKEELEGMGLSSKQIDEILKKQTQKKDRKYKYIVMLTTAEAERLSEQEGKEFVKATEWKNRKK